MHINAHFRIKGLFDNLVKFVYKLGKIWQTRAWHPVFKTVGSAPNAAQKKMYKDKDVQKNVKNIFLSMCDVKVFLTFASLGMVLL